MALPPLAVIVGLVSFALNELWSLTMPESTVGAFAYVCPSAYVVLCLSLTLSRVTFLGPIALNWPLFCSTHSSSGCCH